MVAVVVYGYLQCRHSGPRKYRSMVDFVAAVRQAAVSSACSRDVVGCVAGGKNPPQ